MRNSAQRLVGHRVSQRKKLRETLCSLCLCAGQILFFTAFSMHVVAAQIEEDGRHNFTLQGSTFINGTISEEKVKDIYQCSFVYSYRLSPYLEFGAGFGSVKGQYITLKNYYFAQERDKLYPFPVNGSFLGHNTIKRNFYNFFGRAKLILYEGIISPFFLIDFGYSHMSYSEVNNLLGFYFTPSVGYDIHIFNKGKLVMMAGFDRQKIKYETVESYYDVQNPDHPVLNQVNMNRSLRDKFINGLKLSVGFTIIF